MNTFSFNPPNGLLDKTAFPTIPASEEEARGQIQTPLTQIKDFINNQVVVEIDKKATASNFVFDKNTEGSMKFEGGLILKWGTITIDSGEQTSNGLSYREKTVTFKEAFPGVCLGGQVTSNWREHMGYKKATSKTGITVGASLLANTWGNSADLTYFVWGY